LLVFAVSDIFQAISYVAPHTYLMSANAQLHPQHAFWLIYKRMKAEEQYGHGGFQCTRCNAGFYSFYSYIVAQMSGMAITSPSIKLKPLLSRPLITVLLIEEDVAERWTSDFFFF
jgi:hypothetical protein